VGVGLVRSSVVITFMTSSPGIITSDYRFIFMIFSCGITLHSRSSQSLTFKNLTKGI
jgi:hypothetical protein